ncbi:MAG: hypothetical protein MI746_09015 [Pseudomonadales bacterium]|nr:hypothetical protein [Pseudomonadales bacterium]
MSDSLAQDRHYPDSPIGLFCLIHGDRLGTLMGRFAIASPTTAAVFAASTSFTAAVITAMEGTLINPELTLDLLHDIGWWNQFFLAFATLIYIAGAYFGAFPKTLRQLVDSGVLQASEDDWKTVRRYTKARLNSRFVVFLPYVCGFAAALLSLTVIQAPGAWFDISTYNAGFVIPVHSFFLYYLLSYLTLRLHLAYLVLRAMFKFKVNIQPFHTDGCGGLGALETQSAKLYLGLLVFGAIAALGVISNTVNFGTELFALYNLAMLGSYVLITSIAFFLPLYATSFRMREAQDKFLHSINDRYRALRANLGDDLVSKGSNEDILALESLKATARAMQVWPFNYAALLKFAAVVSSPFLVLALFTLFN